MLAALFLAWLGLRLTGAFVDSTACDPVRRLPDESLPVYTIISALYREAASVDGLLTAIERLDYPGITSLSHFAAIGPRGGVCAIIPGIPVHGPGITS
jgi:hypothetical protein